MFPFLSVDVRSCFTAILKAAGLPRVIEKKTLEPKRTICACGALIANLKFTLVRGLHDPGVRGYSQKIWVGVCGPLPKTLTLFMIKICDFPYPIYDLTKNLISYL